MTELFIKYRLKFNKEGTQKVFLVEARKSLGLTGHEFSKKLGISQRTLSDWTREKFNIPYDAAKIISKLTKISIPKNHTIIDCTENLRKAGKIGGRKSFHMYGNVGGDKNYRKKKWQDWWDTIGQYKENPEGYQSIIKIKKPRKNKKLAEFVGIMLGDGGVNKYHISVTLSSEEKEYILYVQEIIKDLFDINSKTRKHKGAKAVSIIVNRKEMVNFCQSIGLVQGNKIKQQIDIPLWVKENKNFIRECIRGLIDTDGCFYVNTYKVNGKSYSYFKIAFISASKPLIKSFSEALEKFGINSVIDKKNRDVRIVETDSVNKYIKEFGSHNEKHLQKIRQWKKP